MNAPSRNRGRRTGRNTHSPVGGGGTLRWLAPAFHRLLDRLDRGLAAGTIEASLPDGTTRFLGARSPGPVAEVTVHSWRALLRLVTGGSAGWYEAWAAGEWSSPDPVPLFDLFMRNRVPLGNLARASGPTRAVKRWLHWLHHNDRAGARRNIRYHYDLGNDFYRLWLDPSLTYSSALFDTSDDLSAAQARKLDAILARTGTKSGERILEIGCGWGSFAERAARAGRRVHAITLSEHQAEAAIARNAGLDGVTVAITDYRDVDGEYDAVASIEMVEAVGQAYWSDYLATIARVLKPGGRAAIQYIAIDDAIFDAYAANVDFIQTYIFPGGMLLSTSRFRALAERHGLAWRDPHAFGPDYARTLREWRHALDRAVAEHRLPADLDRGFVDLWRYYLMYCEGGFAGGGIDVVQVTLVKGGKT